jgi:hypothetical protein
VRFRLGRPFGALVAIALMSSVVAWAAGSASAGTGQEPAARSGSRAVVRTIDWDGHTWTVRKGSGGPGPNRWDPKNAWVDRDGYLHVRIAFDGGRWSCAELETTDRLGFGTYSWVVDGSIGSLDPNVVLGLFDYPTPDVGGDGTNEIDVEYARWGNASYPPGDFTVWPAKHGLKPRGHAFDFTLSGSLSTSTFVRSSGAVAFQAVDGGGATLGGWTFAPKDPNRRIPQAPTPVHINLWLFEGRPPTDGLPVELVIRSFMFTPAAP